MRHSRYVPQQPCGGTSPAGRILLRRRMAHCVGRAHVSKGFRGRRVHLHHVSPPEGPPSGQGGAGQRLAVVHAGRQDRRARRERRGQVDPAADHGRARPRLLRRRRAGARGDGGPAAAGAATSTPPRTCAATWRRAPPHQVGLLRRFEEIGAKLGEMEPDEMQTALVEYGELQEEIDRLDAWDLERKLDVAMDALRVPPGDQDVTTLSGGERRRVALCRLLLSAPGPAAAGRAHQPPRRRVGGLAGAPPGGVRRHRRGRHPRPLLPGQRGRLDPGAGPRQGHPLEGQLLVLARAEAHAAGAGGEGRVGPPEGPGPGARVGAQLAQGPPGQEQGARRQLREAGRRGGRAPQPPGRDPDPRAARASATWCSRPTTSPRASATAC